MNHNIKEFKCPKCLNGKMIFKTFCGFVSVYECDTCGNTARINYRIRKEDKKQ